MNFRWITDDGFPSRYVPRHDRPRADDCVFADPYSGKDDGTGSNKSEFTDCHFASERCSGCDMGPIAYDTVVINGCVGVDNDGLAEPGVCADGTHGKNLATITDQCTFGNEGTRVHYGEAGVTTISEPILARQPIPPVGSSNGYACAHLIPIVVLPLPFGESRLTVENGDAAEWRCQVTDIKNSYKFCIVKRKCFPQHLCLSGGPPENDGGHCWLPIAAITCEEIRANSMSERS